MLSKLHSVAMLILLAPTVCAAKDELPNYITHGPILGRLSSDGVGVWGRTARAGSFAVGDRVKVWWRREGQHYLGVITAISANDRWIDVKYDDGEEEKGVEKEKGRGKMNGDEKEEEREEKR